MPATSRRAARALRRSYAEPTLVPLSPAAAQSATDCAHAVAPPEPSSPSASSGKPLVLHSAIGEELVLTATSADGLAEIQQVRSAIVRANIGKALEGSYLHMKALFEYAGLWPAQSPGNDEEEPSLAALLLEQIDKARGPDVAAQ